MNLNLLRRLRIWAFGLPPQPEKIEECYWCVVGNIIDEHPEGAERKIAHGTRRFSPGTKVYCMAPQWGDGYERVICIGRGRKSKRMITVIQSVSNITNWRAKDVYHPEALRRLKDGLKGFRRQWKSKEEVEAWVEHLREREARKNDSSSRQ